MSAVSRFGSRRTQLLPALSSLDDECGAGERGEDEQDPEGLSLESSGHRRQSQRIPAPTVRAMDARSISAHVKRARFFFTFDSFEPVGRRSLGSRAVFRDGKIPGFASPSHDGFALDEVAAEEEVLDTDNGSGVPDRPWPVGTTRAGLGRQCVQSTLGQPRGPVASTRRPPRIALTTTTTTPTARMRSPMLKMLLNGSQDGSAKMSVSGSRAGWATTALLE
jgi:hypothetical protein